MNTFTVKKTIFVDVAPELVFDALTNSEEITKYFPLKEVVSEWKVGSEVLYKGEINGQNFSDFGVIEILTRPNKYKYTYWSDNHGTERTPENHLSITYVISKNGDGTKLELEQSNLKSKEMFQMMDEVVWDSLLNNLKNHVESNTHNG